MLKPVFVSRAQRDTVKEKEALEKEEEEQEKKRQEKMKERKVLRVLLQFHWLRICQILARARV